MVVHLYPPSLTLCACSGCSPPTSGPCARLLIHSSERGAGREGDCGGHQHASQDAAVGHAGGVQGARPLQCPRLPEHRGAHQEGEKLANTAPKSIASESASNKLETVLQEK